MAFDQTIKRKKVAILGSGNIGMNLLYKLRRSPLLEVSILIGRDKNSPNLALADKMGFHTSADSVDAILRDPEECEIVFDATTAAAHVITAPLLKKIGKFVVDLTPSRTGKLCIPCLNGEECVFESDVNMVTCGGQSLIPLAYAISKVSHVQYFETNSTIASLSAGIGTRDNIDEYILTTQQALSQFTGVEKTKSMIVLNPANPPIIMHNTLYSIIHNPDIDCISDAVYDMVPQIQKYVPGFTLIMPPTLYTDDTVAIGISVCGSGDFLPEYAGNLDIITCAAIEMAEMHALEMTMRDEACPF